MDTAEEEGRNTGKLKPGQRTAAGVVTQDVYDALLALQRRRRIPTISKTVGEALREWARQSDGGGLKPDAGGGGNLGTSDTGDGLKPTQPRDVTLSPWQEVRGLVREVREEGDGVRVVLEERGDLVALRLPRTPPGPRIREGATVAILRTDGAGPEFVVRTLD